MGPVEGALSGALVFAALPGLAMLFMLRGGTRYPRAGHRSNAPGQSDRGCGPSESTLPAQGSRNLGRREGAESTPLDMVLS